MDPTLIFVIFAAIFLLIVTAGIVAAVRRKKEINWLKEHGKHVQATVSEIRSERVTIQVPRQVPQTRYNPATKSIQTTYHTEFQAQWQTRYFIIARYEDSPTKQQIIFKSDGMVSEPRNYLQGSEILVDYDPVNPTRYYMHVA